VRNHYSVGTIYLLLRATGILWISLFASSASAAPHAQRLTQYGHTAWHVQDGLFGSPNTIAQTKDGYLWLGTDAGLVRFDGVRFVPWNNFSDGSIATWAIYKVLAALPPAWLRSRIVTFLGMKIWAGPSVWSRTTAAPFGLLAHVSGMVRDPPVACVMASSLATESPTFHILLLGASAKVREGAFGLAVPTVYATGSLVKLPSVICKTLCGH
jgi:hypothetical protein